MTDVLFNATIFCLSIFASFAVMMAHGPSIMLVICAILSGLYLGLLIKSSIKYAEQIKG